MNIKIKQLLKIVFYLGFIYSVKSSLYDLNNLDRFFVKSVPNNTALNLQKYIQDSHNPTLNSQCAHSTGKFLSDAINKIELKLESLINDKIEKLNKKLTTLINDNMDKLEDTIKEMNKKNYFMLKMDHMTINKMNEEIELVNHKYKCSNITMPRSCYDLVECESGIYNLILPEVSFKPFPAACDLKTLDGGWTIIQRRQDGSENFYRNWSEYTKGFGNINGEFFLGLNKLHTLTTSGDPQELYIILQGFNGERKYARYGEFKVDSENNGFKLTVKEYSGTAGDSLTYHNNMKFTTRDRDNDNAKSNCAEVWNGAWWYNLCFQSNLNGQYYTGEKIKTPGGIVWSAFQGLNSSLKFTQMMIRTKKN